LGADLKMERAGINSAYSTLYKVSCDRGGALDEQGRFEAASRSYQAGHRFLINADQPMQAGVKHSMSWDIAEGARSVATRTPDLLKFVGAISGSTTKALLSEWLADGC